MGAIVYRHFVPQLSVAFSQFYLHAPFDAAGVQAWREPLLLDRIAQYAIFLPEVALAALVFAVAVRWPRPLDAAAQRIEREVTRSTAVLLVILVGMVGVWLSTREWRRYGQPCWDGYCAYGKTLLATIRSERGGRASLAAFVRADYHCNSPMGPLLSALSSLITSLSIVSSYRLVCGLSSVGAVAIFFRFLARSGSASCEIRLLQILLLMTNAAFVRSFVFPQTDALVLFWSAAVFAAALAFAHRPTIPLRLLLLALGVTGVFVKLSFLPLLAVAPLCRAACHLLGERPTPSRVIRAAGIALGEGLLLVGLPLAAFFSFQLLAGTLAQYRRELSMATTLDFHPLFIVEAFGQVMLPAVVLLWIGRRALTGDDRLLLIWLPVFFVALGLGHASGWSRFYLAPMPALAMLARPGLERLGRRGRSLPWLFVAVTAGLNYLALEQRIIH